MASALKGNHHCSLTGSIMKVEIIKNPPFLNETEEKVYRVILAHGEITYQDLIEEILKKPIDETIQADRKFIDGALVKFRDNGIIEVEENYWKVRKYKLTEKGKFIKYVEIWDEMCDDVLCYLHNSMKRHSQILRFIRRKYHVPDNVIDGVLRQLIKEGLVVQRNNHYCLTAKGKDKTIPLDDVEPIIVYER